MPVVSCPKCATGLRVPDGAAGTIRCPKCQTTFAPPKSKAAGGFEVVESAPPKASPKPPPPRPAPKPAAEEPDFDPIDEPAPARPRAAPPAAGKKAFSLDDAVRSADKRSTERREAEKAPPPRRDDRDDDRPRGRRDRDDDYDDRRDDRDDDDDRREERRSRKPSKYGTARPAALLLLISLGLNAGSMALYTLFILVAWMGVVLPNALEVMTGVLGLAGWVVGLAGLGTAIGGPAKARGLVIAALVVSFLHLTMAVVVANKGSSFLFGHGAVSHLSAENRVERIQNLNKEFQKEFQANPTGGRAKAIQAEIKSLSEEPRAARVRIRDDSSDFFGGEMRWTDMLTTLPRLDKLLMLLVYSPKAFEFYVWGVLGGMLELARLVLVCLALAALARAVKGYRAETLAKIGWIAGAAAVGVSLLVMLLAHVLVESSAKDAMRPRASAPPEMPRMQLNPNGNFQQQQADFQRQMADWQQQQQREFEQMADRGRSIARSIRFWVVSSELLIFLLHTGALVTPILGAWGVFVAAGRR